MLKFGDQIHSAQGSPDAQQIDKQIEKSLAKSISEESSSSTKKYPVISEKDFYRLARNEPEKLLQLIEDEILEPHELTFAAEAAGSIQDENRVVPVLFRLLEHSSPLVREGAVYGLSSHLSGNVIERLRELKRRDRSPGVREAAREALEEILPD